MDRPYIICHMTATLDGKISGPAFSYPETAELSRHYQQLHRAIRADATAYGKTTVEEILTRGRRPDLAAFQDAAVPREDFIADAQAAMYLVAVDPDGGLGWTGAAVQGRGPGYDGAHIIEILQEDVSDAYLAYLRGIGISYLFGGVHSICLADVCVKLRRYFGIERMLVQGGGVLNGSFAAEDLIDELSLLLAPAADCGTGRPSLFEAPPGLAPAPEPRRFVRESVQKLENSGLALRYRRAREGEAT